MPSQKKKSTGRSLPQKSMLDKNNIPACKSGHRKCATEKELSPNMPRKKYNKNACSGRQLPTKKMLDHNQKTTFPRSLVADTNA